MDQEGIVAVEVLDLQHLGASRRFRISIQCVLRYIRHWNLVKIGSIMVMIPELLVFEFRRQLKLI